MRGGAASPVIMMHWNGAPIDEFCNTLVERRVDPDAREGSAKALVRACDVVLNEGQFAT